MADKVPDGTVKRDSSLRSSTAIVPTARSGYVTPRPARRRTRPPSLCRVRRSQPDGNASAAMPALALPGPAVPTP